MSVNTKNFGEISSTFPGWVIISSETTQRPIRGGKILETINVVERPGPNSTETSGETSTWSRSHVIHQPTLFTKIMQAISRVFDKILGLSESQSPICLDLKPGDTIALPNDHVQRQKMIDALGLYEADEISSVGLVRTWRFNDPKASFAERPKENNSGYHLTRLV